jgi:hypothetical protein
VRPPVTSRFNRGSHRTMSKRSPWGFRYPDAARQPCGRSARVPTGREVGPPSVLIISICNDLRVRHLSAGPGSAGQVQRATDPARWICAQRARRGGSECSRPGAADLSAAGRCHRTWAQPAGRAAGAPGDGATLRRGGEPEPRSVRMDLPSGALRRDGSTAGTGIHRYDMHVSFREYDIGVSHLPSGALRSDGSTTGQAFMDMTCTSALGNMTSASANGLQRNGISTQGRTQRARERAWPPNTIRSPMQTGGKRRRVCQLTLASFLLFK